MGPNPLNYTRFFLLPWAIAREQLGSTVAVGSGHGRKTVLGVLLLFLEEIDDRGFIN